MQKVFLILCFAVLFSHSKAQLEVAHVSTKGYSTIGFGGFINLSFREAEVNYITFDANVEYFKNKNTDEMGLGHFLAGFRYTLNQSGEGFFIEPNAGYTIGTADGLYNFNGGVCTGANFGYLFNAGGTPFDISFRFLHVFSDPSLNIFSLRIAHSFTLGRRNED